MTKSAHVKQQVFIRMLDADRRAGQLIAREWGMIESEFWRQFAGIYPEGTEADPRRTTRLRHAYDQMRAKLRKK